MSELASIKISLPYFEDSARLFHSIADQPWAMLLDSGYPQSSGRYDILVADPVCTVVTRKQETQISRPEGSFSSNQDPFAIVKEELKRMTAVQSELPFTAGAVGYFAYDLARRLEKQPELAVDAEQLPEMAVGIYAWAVVVDHTQQQSWLTGDAHADVDWDALKWTFSQLPELDFSYPFKVLAAPQSNLDKNSYAAAIKRIKQYLKEGDCYQINLAQRFCSPCSGNPWQAYYQLRQLNAAPFSAYLNLPDVQVLSSSPERFLQVVNGQVETKPIKGTRPRNVDPSEDERQKHLLAESLKDRAENLMIVDLLRNDISKNCRRGSVYVPKLFDVESYATVHHLVSTVSGQLTADHHALDLLRGCFPGGSITGAPKIRAMEIIEELEPHRRGIYCGSIGYIGCDGNMDSNIAIRTLVHSDQTIRFWAGGGIVNDSETDAEYQECFDKAQALLTLLKYFS